MPHICHISTTFNLRSGSARRTSAIINGCLEQGMKTSLIIGRDHDVVQADLPGVDIHIVPELVKYIAPRLDLVAPLKIAEVLRDIKPDLVHTHLAKAGIFGRLAARKEQVPCIMHTVHGPSFPRHFHLGKRTLFLMLEKLCGRFTDHLIFVGHDLQQEYIKAGVCTYESSVVIQTGQPEAVFDRPRMINDRKNELRLELCDGIPPAFCIVVVGRLVPSKQVEHAIQAVQILHHKKIVAHLAIVGKCLLPEEQQYEEKLDRLSQDIGVQPYVHFAGFRNDIIDVMEAADAVLLTSRYEGLPNVAVEAVIAGTPMVTYDVSGVQEIIETGVNGEIVPQGDVKSIAENLQQVARYVPFSKEKMCHHNKNLQFFREGTMVEKKIHLYSQFLPWNNRPS